MLISTTIRKTVSGMWREYFSFNKWFCFILIPIFNTFLCLLSVYLQLISSVLFCPRGCCFRAFSHVNFCPGGRGFAAFFARGMGISPPQKIPRGSARGMLTAGIDGYIKMTDGTLIRADILRANLCLGFLTSVISCTTQLFRSWRKYFPVCNVFCYKCALSLSQNLRNVVNTPGHPDHSDSILSMKR